MSTSLELRRKLKILLASVAGSLLLLWLLVFHSRVDFVPAAMSLPDSVERYRAAGFYWTAADIPSPKISDADNAAGLLLEAGKSLPTVKVLVDSKADVPAATKKLEDCSRALALAETASHRRYLRYSPDRDQTQYDLFPQFSSLKDIVKDFCLRAECGAFDDSRAMRADLSTALRLTALYEQNPTLIGFLVQIACQEVILRTIEFCASVERDNVGELSALTQILQENPIRSDLPKAMKDEAYFEISTLRNLKQSQAWKFVNSPDNPEDEYPDPGPISSLKRDGYPDSMLARAYLARLLQGWTRVAPIIDQRRNEPEKLGEEVDASLSQEPKRNGLSGLIFTPNLVSMFAGAGKAELKVRTQELCSLALIGALRSSKRMSVKMQLVLE